MSSSYKLAVETSGFSLKSYLAAALNRARFTETRAEAIADLTAVAAITVEAYHRAGELLYVNSSEVNFQAANNAAEAAGEANHALKKAIKGPTVRDEAAITAALDALDAALLAVSVAARNAAAFDDGAGDTYDTHLDAEYAIRRVFDLTN